MSKEKKILKQKVYSKIDKIPRAKAIDSITEGCIVLEGGALLGLYTAGVLDGLMLMGINMQTTIGVSAGAMFGMGYVSGQIGREAKFNLSNRFNQRYIGAGAELYDHSFFSIPYLFDDSHYDEPFDAERFYRTDRRFLAVATDCETGQPAFFEKGKCKNIFDGIRASATIPILSAMVEIDDGKYLDGCCSLNIPYQWALDEGFEHVIVVRTKEREYRQKVFTEVEKQMVRRRYRAFPELAETFAQSAERFNAECDELDRLEEEGKVFVIVPSRVITHHRAEPNVEKLGALYRLGMHDVKHSSKKLKSFLGI